MNYKQLLISLALPQLAGVVGSFFTVSSIPVWYAALEKPAFSPPNWLFGPVWVLLYFLMGISIYLVWLASAKASADKPADKIIGVKKIRTAFWLFWVHLFFNAVWSVIFFGLKNPGLALLDIIIIWVLIVVLIIKFWPINRWSAYLLIPYFLWVSFASALNYFIWYLN